MRNQNGVEELCGANAQFHRPPIDVAIDYEFDSSSVFQRKEYSRTSEANSIWLPAAVSSLRMGRSQCAIFDQSISGDAKPHIVRKLRLLRIGH